MEEQFSQLTLDVIGLSVFNYNFDALTADSPVIDAVYTALKEAEARATDFIPYWKASWFLFLLGFFLHPVITQVGVLLGRLKLCAK